EPVRGGRGDLLRLRHRPRGEPEEDHVQLRRAPAARALPAHRRSRWRRGDAGGARHLNGVRPHFSHLDALLKDLPPLERYKLLIGLVIPRPIAWISTYSANGVANCAPFSFFNVFSEDPPLCVIGINPRSDGAMKHTLKNIRRTREFVVNLVDEATANAMHLSGEEFAEDVSEFDKAGLTPA